MNNRKPREAGGQRGCNLLIFVDLPCRSAQLRGRLGSALLTCEWDGSCEVARGYRMGLWAYASSLNTPCPQDIAPIRATILMASQTDFPNIVPTIQSTPVSYPTSIEGQYANPPRVIRVFTNVSSGGHKYAQVLLKYAYLHVGFLGFIR